MPRSSVEIEQSANTLRDRCGVSGYGITDVFEFAERLGYHTIQYPFDDSSLCGVAVVRHPDRIVISNSSLILSREIFTVAHEIAHQVLHLQGVRMGAVVDEDIDSQRTTQEREANRFAAALLIPPSRLREFIRLELHKESGDDFTGLDVARIQTAFSVSYDVVIIQLQQLRLIGMKQYDQLKEEKAKSTASALLRAIGGNTDLCKPTGRIHIPPCFIEWTLSNYRNGLIEDQKFDELMTLVGIPAEPFHKKVVQDDPEDVDWTSIEALL